MNNVTFTERNTALPARRFRRLMNFPRVKRGNRWMQREEAKRRGGSVEMKRTTPITPANRLNFTTWTTFILAGSVWKEGNNCGMGEQWWISRRASEGRTNERNVRRQRGINSNVNSFNERSHKWWQFHLTIITTTPPCIFTHTHTHTHIHVLLHATRYYTGCNIFT